MVSVTDKDYADRDTPARKAGKHCPALNLWPGALAPEAFLSPVSALDWTTHDVAT